MDWGFRFLDKISTAGTSRSGPRSRLFVLNSVPAARANRHFSPPPVSPRSIPPPEPTSCHAMPCTASLSMLPSAYMLRVLHATLPVILPAYLSGPRLPPPRGLPSPNPIVQPVPNQSSTPPNSPHLTPSIKPHQNPPTAHPHRTTPLGRSHPKAQRRRTSPNPSRRTGGCHLIISGLCSSLV